MSLVNFYRLISVKTGQETLVEFWFCLLFLRLYFWTSRHFHNTLNLDQFYSFRRPPHTEVQVSFVRLNRFPFNVKDFTAVAGETLSFVSRRHSLRPRSDWNDPSFLTVPSTSIISRMCGEKRFVCLFVCLFRLLFCFVM